MGGREMSPYVLRYEQEGYGERRPLNNEGFPFLQATSFLPPVTCNWGSAELDVVLFDEWRTRRYYSNAPPTTMFRTCRYHGL